MYTLAGDVPVNSKIGTTSEPQGKGLYLGTSKKFVIDFYTGLSDYKDVLLTYRYDIKHIMNGDPDEDGEITVTKATLVDKEVLQD